MSCEPCQKPDCICICSKESCFPDLRKVSLVVPVLSNPEDVLLKTTTLLVFFLWLVKSEKLVYNRINDHTEKCGLFLISSMVLGFLDQLQIF